MTELVLLAVICVLSGLLAWDRYENRKENQKMIQAIMSKSVQDLKDFELTEKLNLTTPEQPLGELPDLTAVEDLSDKDFSKFVLGDQEDNG